MSLKRLMWTGLTCLVLSVLTAGLGCLAQAGLVLLAILFFRITIQMPVGAAHGVVGETTLSVPRVLPAVLSVAWLFLAIALGCCSNRDVVSSSSGRHPVPFLRLTSVREAISMAAVSVGEPNNVGSVFFADRQNRRGLCGRARKTSA